MKKIDIRFFINYALIPLIIFKFLIQRIWVIVTKTFYFSSKSYPRKKLSITQVIHIALFFHIKHGIIVRQLQVEFCNSVVISIRITL